MLAHQQRKRGFFDELNARFPDIKITDCVDIDDMDTHSYTQTLNILSKTPDLDGLYLTGGGISGAVGALEKCGMQKKVRIVCFDLLPRTKAYLREGVIDFVIGQDQFFQGYKPVIILSEYLMANKKPEKSVYFTKIDIRVNWNVD